MGTGLWCCSPGWCWRWVVAAAQRLRFCELFCLLSCSASVPVCPSPQDSCALQPSCACVWPAPRGHPGVGWLQHCEDSALRGDLRGSLCPRGARSNLLRSPLPRGEGRAEPRRTQPVWSSLEMELSSSPQGSCSFLGWRGAKRAPAPGGEVSAGPWRGLRAASWQRQSRLSGDVGSILLLMLRFPCLCYPSGSPAKLEEIAWKSHQPTCNSLLSRCLTI